MNLLIRQLFYTLIGIAFAVFGVYHAATSYPDASAFSIVHRELPKIIAVVSFYLGIALAVVGAIFLLPLIVRSLRSRQRQLPAYPGMTPPRPAPDRDEEDWGFEDEDNGFNPERDDYDRRHRHGGYDPYAHGHAGRNGRLATTRR